MAKPITKPTRKGWKAFVLGAASILDIGSTLARPRRASHWFEQDIQALQKDQAMLRNDMRQTLARFNTSYTPHSS